MQEVMIHQKEIQVEQVRLLQVQQVEEDILLLEEMEYLLTQEEQVEQEQILVHIFQVKH
jgi:hypothetical protein